MEELKKINSKIAVKQIGRIVGGSCFMVLGMVLVARHINISDLSLRLRSFSTFLIVL